MKQKMKRTSTKDEIEQRVRDGEGSETSHRNEPDAPVGCLPPRRMTLCASAMAAVPRDPA
jgi:hypothetical protein